ncbi:hypothetical protein LCGC14_2697480 [marine sediment metagenome]|uniref:Uncharacterized protein n=1 Tax=marine sediment metagenome TaxID=412755 RepID=A0A0F8ZGW4_9ZZZZ
MSEEQLEAVVLANTIRNSAIENQALTARLAEVEGQLREAVKLVSKAHRALGWPSLYRFLKPQQPQEDSSG